MARRLAATAATVVVLGLLLTAALLFWPRALGGSVSYVTLRGTSMNPRFNAGDLVVIREDPDPQVGDIVAYRSDPSGALVLHRIIARNGDRYVFKGDNNNWVDTDQPVAGALVGNYWFRVPRGGDFLGWLSGPWRAGLLGGGMAAMSVLGLTGSAKNQETTGKRAARAAAPRAGRRTRRTIRRAVGRVFPIAAGIGLCCAALLAYAMTEPATVSVARELRYEQRGEFSYSGPVSMPGAYEGPELETGDPAFLNLTEYLDFAFNYSLETSAAADVSGTIQLMGIVGDITGWHRAAGLSEVQPFYATKGRATARAPLQPLFDALALSASLTGSSPLYFTALVVANVHVSGTLDGRPLDITFDPFVTFRVVPPNQLYVETTTTRLLEKLAPPSANADADPFHDSRAGTIPFESPAPKTIAVAGQSLSIDTLRSLGAAGLGVALLAAAVSGVALIAFTRRSATFDDLLADNADALFNARDEQLKPSGLVAVTVDSPEELFRLAAYLDRPVLRETGPRGPVLVVHDRERVYVAEPGEEAKST